MTKTRIFTKEDIIRYTETRIFGLNVTPEQVKEIHLHNGYLPSEIEKLIRSEHGQKFEIVQQPNAREPIYFHDGILDIPQWSGIARRERYERMIKAYKKAKNDRITFQTLNLPQGVVSTNTMYEHFAYDFLKAAIYPEKLNEQNIFSRLFKERDIKEVRHIIFGPRKAIKEYASLDNRIEIVDESNCEYINSMIIRVNGVEAFNVSYVHGDQIGTLINKGMKLMDGVAREKGLKKDLINFYMFGRSASLDESIQVNNLVVPTGVMDISELDKTPFMMYPIRNILVNKKMHRGYNLNVRSVMDETFEDLTQARDKGMTTIDMELWDMLAMINDAKNRSVFDIELGVVFYISDRPLVGETLAKEYDISTGKLSAVKTIIDNIDPEHKR